MKFIAYHGTEIHLYSETRNDIIMLEKLNTLHLRKEKNNGDTKLATNKKKN